MKQRKMQVASYLLPLSAGFKGASVVNGGTLGTGNVDGRDHPIVFQFLPKISGDSKTANYQSVGDVLGRSEQLMIYRNGQNRTITITAQFAAVDSSQGGLYVQRQVSRIRALLEPVYSRNNLVNTSAYYAPPLVLFTYGKRFINVPIIVETVSVEDMEGTMISIGYGLPQAVQVTITAKTSYPYGYVPGYFDVKQLYGISGSINYSDETTKGMENNETGYAPSIDPESPPDYNQLTLTVPPMSSGNPDVDRFVAIVQNEIPSNTAPTAAPTEIQ